LDGQGRVWLTSRDSDVIQIMDNEGGSIQAIELGYGAAPMDIVADLSTGKMYASLYGSGEIVRLDANSLSIDGRLAVGATVKALALSEEHQTLLATRFISAEHEAEVWQVDLSDFTLHRTFKLLRHTEDDSLENGRGIPNYLAGITLNRAGTRAYVVGKKDNVDRGLINGNPDLDDDNTVRTLAAVLDLESGEELTQYRFDFDNADSPSGVRLSDDEQFLFVAMQGRNQVFVLNVSPDTGRYESIAGQFLVESAPQALAYASDSETLFVKNFLSRSVSMIDLSKFLNGGDINPATRSLVTVANEKLSDEVLKGKQLFYHAAEGVQGDDSPIGRMSAEGYISCATCHFDGGHDGRTYDFTGRGEGMRNNIALNGRGGARFGNLHWSANFDEVQDFENDIRNVFKGRGLMTDVFFNASSDPLGREKRGLSNDLDALAAYVESLNKDSVPRSPYRSADGSMTEQAVAGQALFEQMDCQTCHRPPAFTDGSVHDVGTVRAYSGNTRDELLSVIKTPSLLGVFDSAPYLHDGSAPTLADVFMVAGGTVIQAESLAMSSTAEVITPEGFSYLRNGAGVRLAPNAEVVVEHNAGVNVGQGALRVRAGGNEQPVSLALNDTDVIEVPAHQSVAGEIVAYSEFTVQVNYDSGINLWVLRNDSNQTVVVDDVTLVTPDVYTQAHAHTKVLEKSTTEQQQLVAFLQQIDRALAPEDDETLVLGAEQGPEEETPEPEVEPPTQTGGGSEPQMPAANSSDNSGGGSFGPLMLMLLLMFGWRVRRKTRL
ncbi:MAG TPA: beta-propeller fold lactonase family protein, partial [Cellvibrionaceae bacterium]